MNREGAIDRLVNLYKTIVPQTKVSFLAWYIRTCIAFVFGVLGGLYWLYYGY